MGISKQEFARRRKNLMALLEPGSIAIVPSASLQTRSRDSEYPFRQDSDFFYLSGFDEPEAVLVLLPGREQGFQLAHRLFTRNKVTQDHQAPLMADRFEKI